MRKLPLLFLTIFLLAGVSCKKRAKIDYSTKVKMVDLGLFFIEEPFNNKKVGSQFLSNNLELRKALIDSQYFDNQEIDNSILNEEMHPYSISVKRQLGQVKEIEIKETIGLKKRNGKKVLLSIRLLENGQPFFDLRLEE